MYTQQLILKIASKINYITLTILHRLNRSWLYDLVSFFLILGHIFKGISLLLCDFNTISIIKFHSTKLLVYHVIQFNHGRSVPGQRRSNAATYSLSWHTNTDYHVCSSSCISLPLFPHESGFTLCTTFRVC